jgi:hypothetical protein
VLRIEFKLTTIAILRSREKNETESPYHDSLSSHDDDLPSNYPLQNFVPSGIYELYAVAQPAISEHHPVAELLAESNTVKKINKHRDLVELRHLAQLWVLDYARDAVHTVLRIAEGSVSRKSSGNIIINCRH